MVSIKQKDLVIGTWALGGDYWGEQKHSDSIKMLHSAIREGFKSFDTAPVYGNGKSEQLLGQQFKNIRNSITISTKCFLKTRNQFTKSIEHSLKRLNTDYIDNFFIHWPSTKLDCRPTIEYLEECRDRGIIKKIGLSNFKKTDLLKAMDAGSIDIIQNAYNFFWSKDREYFQFCSDKGIETQAYSVLAQGLLTGKFSEKTPYKESDLRHKMILFDKCNIDVVYKYLEELNKLSEIEKCSLYQLILIWTLSKPYINKAVIGCRNRKQIEDLKNVFSKNISEETLSRLNKLSGEVSHKIIGEDNIFNHFY